MTIIEPIEPRWIVLLEFQFPHLPRFWMLNYTENGLFHGVFASGYGTQNWPISPMVR